MPYKNAPIAQAEFGLAIDMLILRARECGLPNEAMIESLGDAVRGLRRAVARGGAALRSPSSRPGPTTGATPSASAK